MALIDDPDLLDQILREFRIKGQISPFDLSNIAVPVIDIGLLTGIALSPTVVTTLAGNQGVRVGTGAPNEYLHTGPQGFVVAGFNNRGSTVNPAAGAVISDSGALGPGLVVFYFVINWDAAILDFQVEWRNAANSANLGTIGFLLGTGQPSVKFGPITLSLGTNERLRVVTASGGIGTADATVINSGSVTISGAL